MGIIFLAFSPRLVHHILEGRQPLHGCPDVHGGGEVPNVEVEEDAAEGAHGEEVDLGGGGGATNAGEPVLLDEGQEEVVEGHAEPIRNSHIFY